MLTNQNVLKGFSVCLMRLFTGINLLLIVAALLHLGYLIYNPAFCLKCDTRTIYLNHLYLLAGLSFILFVGYVLYVCYPKIGLLIEVTPIILGGGLFCYWLLDKMIYM